MPPPVVPDAQWLWDNEPCRAACPVHTDAGAYVTAIAEGRYRDAYLIARGPNPFASICGRVCAAPCETACRRATVDAPVAIRALKRFVTERFGVESFAASTVWHEAHGPVPAATLGSVGVVGGGPAGLAAAYELRLTGHPVTVYEAADRLGGMMVMGIPEYRLARGLIAREIDAIVELGIDVELSFRVGRDASVDELLSRHEALFLSVGTGRGRDLELPGHELDGVLRAVEFLLNVNQGFRVDLGQRVVVVGGGNVAFDAARTALRAAGGGPADTAEVEGVAPRPHDEVGTADDARRGMITTLDVARAAVRAGVLDVTVIALESPEEIPADPEEIAEAEGEGITILYRKGPHRFVGDGGRITGLETIDVKSVFDEQGRFSPTFLPGSEAVLPADAVILAVGQTADLDLIGGIDLEQARGVIKVDPATLRTSHPRIWAGGDVAHGPRNLIDAIADGQRAAASIHNPATDDSPVQSVRIELGRRAGFRRLSTGYDAIARRPIPATPSDRRVGFAEVEVGYDARDAWLESLRCLRCFDNVMLDPSLCILCGLCVDVCPPNCITIVRADHAGVGTESQSVLLLDEDLCIRCGLCVNRCPPGALSMVHAREVTGD
ncbi:MAG TPA: FAD-dependent oxidoreductase [Acidimicrobiales bacterium]|nr:FAD-dependent oxidoreductase [Acidimicrobiales bacterium]